jgi:N-acetylglucosamine-6-phosphate deacetylase
MLFDHQVNGFAGVDFQREGISLEQMQAVVSALAAHRTSGVLLTLITDSIEALERKLRAFEDLCEQDEAIAEMIRGYHMEGPYLSPKPGFCGAHPAQYMQAPDLHAFDRLQAAANGRIRVITLAPEWTGSAAFIRELSQRGVVTSIGHSDASDADIDAAIEAGLRLCTHLGNGVPAILHRHDNVIQRLLARDELTAAFIPDGIHLPPSVLRNYVRAKPKGKVLFTTDAMAAAGAPPGRYSLGELEMEVGADQIVRMPGSATFAGSALTMDQAVHNVMDWLGWSEEAANNAMQWNDVL